MNHKQDTPLANHHISVDCVIVGFDGEQLKVLLLKRTFKEGDTETQDMKLPGDLIYQDENLDDAANRVLTEQAGIKRMSTVQFKAYGSRNRTDKERDIKCIIRKTKRFAIPERAVYFLKTKRTAGGTPPPQNIFDRLTPVFT